MSTESIQSKPDNLQSQLETISNIEVGLLKPEVRSYVENLKAQAEEILITFHGRLAEAPMEKLEELKAIIQKLKYTVAHNEVMFDEKVFFKEISKVVSGWAELMMEWKGGMLKRPGDDFDMEQPFFPRDFSLEYLESAAREILNVPKEVLMTRPEFSQKLLECIYKELPDPIKKFSGAPFSIFMREIIVNLGDESNRSDVTQSIDVSGFFGRIDYLAYQWPGGTLTIEGEVGIYLGTSMSGGVIRAESAGRGVGFGMGNGYITLDEAGDACGMYMKDGTIEVTQVGDQLGSDMSGGLIRVRFTGVDVGFRMKGGIIHISDNAQAISRDGSGGEIWLQGNRVRGS